MGILTDKKGSLSMVRVSILIAVVGGAFLAFGALAFFLDQESRKAPLTIDLPPGAIMNGENRKTATWRELYYTVPGGSIEAIQQFYDRKMLEHYANSPTTNQGERCQRFPPVGNFSDFTNGTNPLPFYFTCFFDRSGLNSTQWTQVTIRPAVPSDTGVESLDTIVIIYEQQWQPN